MPKQIVSVGDLVVDLVLDVKLPAKINEHQMSPTLLFEPGGAASTIFSARNMGLDVVALGTVGADFQGRMLVQMLKEAGVDTSALTIPVESTTTTVVALSDTSQNGHVFLGHYGEGVPIELTPVAADKLVQADAIFMPGYTAVEERLRSLVDDTLKLIDSHQLRFYFDVGPFLGQATEEQVAFILQFVDVLFLTEDEIPYVTRGESGIDALRTLFDSYPDMMIVLKMGSSGCRILLADDEMTCAGYHVQVVDTIGAGDTFAGAFIWAHLGGLPLQECGMIANAMGAASVQVSGAGQNVPTREDVQAILNTNRVQIDLS